MPLGETLRAVAREVAHVSVSEADINTHVPVMAALVAEIELLRALPLKDCEPPLIFVPVAD
jgi:hypothetical protein